MNEYLWRGRIASQILLKTAMLNIDVIMILKKCQEQYLK